MANRIFGLLLAGTTLIAVCPVAAQNAGSQSAPQGPGAPPVAAGNQATGPAPQEQGAPSTAPAPQGPGGGQATPPVSDSSQLQEIVVTATRSATNLQKTPIAVTAITTDQLQARGVSSLQDISIFSPSLSISTTGARIAIRGVSVDTTTQSPAVGVYLDDVYFPASAGNAIGLFDVDRIEVLRGPQGTLFGRNTIAGAIQYVSNKPTHSFGGYIDAIGGSYNRHDFQGALNVLISDTLAFRIAGNSQDRDGFVHDLYTGQYRGARLQRQGRAILRWTPSDRLTIDIEGNYLHSSNNGRALISGIINPNAQFVGLARLFGETRPLTQAYASPDHYSFAGFNQPDFAKFDFREVQGTIGYRISDNLDFKSISAYSYSLSRVAQDLDQTPLNIISTGAAHGVTKLVTEEAQLIGHVFDDRLRFTTGIYYYNSQAPTTGVPGVLIGNVRQPSAGDTERDIDAKAAYGQATYNLTDRLSFTGGLRYSKEDNTSYQLAANAPRLKSSFSNTSPYFGVNFQATGSELFYAKYSRGFKAGGQTVNANLPGGNLAFGPETAETYEVGARLELLDHHVRFNPTFFYTNWNNIQFNLLIPLATTIVTATQNAGDATIRGFELEGQVVATKRLLFTAAASFNHSYYRRVPPLTRNLYLRGYPGPATVLPNITLASALNRSPDTRITLGASYTLPLTGTSKLVTSLSGTYTSSQYANVTISDQEFLPHSTVLQGRIQYDFARDKYSAAFFVTNLTNKFYLTDGGGFGHGYTAGIDELDPARPREFGVQVTARF